MVRGVNGASWVIIQSAPKSKSSFLQGVLERRYPDFEFAYLRFNERDFSKSKKLSRIEKMGILIEAKHLREKDLPLFDRYLKRYKEEAVILILSPTTYSLLRKRRKKTLQTCTVTISDIKNLDYLINIPRLIEDVILRTHLKKENARLRALIDQCRPDERALPLTTQSDAQMTNDLIEENETKRGIKIRLSRWDSLKNNLGDLGQIEFTELLTRAISSTIRNSDRILRSKENEFIVFLPKSGKPHVEQCLKRLNDSLKSIVVTTNQQTLSVPFTLRSFEGHPQS